MRQCSNTSGAITSETPKSPVGAASTKCVVDPKVICQGNWIRLEGDVPIPNVLKLAVSLTGGQYGLRKIALKKGITGFPVCTNRSSGHGAPAAINGPTPATKARARDCQVM